MRKQNKETVWKTVKQGNPGNPNVDQGRNNLAVCSAGIASRGYLAKQAGGPDSKGRHQSGGLLVVDAGLLLTHRAHSYSALCEHASGFA
eukprot:1251740-Amphidinium_carterae.1